MPLVSIRKVRNGKNSKVSRFEIDSELREAYLEYAVNTYERAAKFSREEREFAMRKLATYGIFSATHIAQIFGVHRSMLTRLGIKVNTGQTKMGGAFSPAQLVNLLYTLREKNENEAYSIQHIRLAYEGGMSTGVIARLIGVSTSYVSNMLKKARMTTDDRAVVERAGDPGREGRTEARGAAGVVEITAADLSGVWVTDPGSWPEGHLPNPFGEDGYSVTWGDTPLSADDPHAFVRADDDKIGFAHGLADLTWPCTRSDYGHEGCAANGIAQGLIKQG